MIDALDPCWESFFVNFVATQGQRLPEVPGFEPRASDPQPDAITKRPQQTPRMFFKIREKEGIQFQIKLSFIQKTQTKT